MLFQAPPLLACGFSGFEVWTQFTCPWWQGVSLQCECTPGLPSELRGEASASQTRQLWQPPPPCRLATWGPQFLTGYKLEATLTSSIPGHSSPYWLLPQSQKEKLPWSKGIVILHDIITEVTFHHLGHSLLGRSEWQVSPLLSWRGLHKVWVPARGDQVGHIRVCPMHYQA